MKQMECEWLYRVRECFYWFQIECVVWWMEDQPDVRNQIIFFASVWDSEKGIVNVCLCLTAVDWGISFLGLHSTSIRLIIDNIGDFFREISALMCGRLVCEMDRRTKLGEALGFGWNLKESFLLKVKWWWWWCIGVWLKFRMDFGGIKIEFSGFCEMAGKYI